MAAFYTFLSLVTQLIIIKICNQLLPRVRVGHVDVRVKGRGRRLSGREVRGQKDKTEWNIAWQMDRHVLKQGLRVQFETLTQVLFTSSLNGQ